jgi:mannose-1-phosphate guanylyltransferase
MKAIILVGGLGTRLRPVTYEIPKPLIPVKKKPILNHLIEFFHKNKVSDITLLASRDHEDDFKRWRKSWKGEFPHDNIGLFYEEAPRGTFGGFEVLRDWIGNNSFIVSNGDELKDFDLGKLINLHDSHDGVGTIALVEVPNPQNYGVPAMEGTKITEFFEKPENPSSNFINSGLYMYKPEVFNYVDFSQKGEIMSERHIFPVLAKEGKLHGAKLEGRWYDCGNIERWEKAIKEW